MQQLQTFSTDGQPAHRRMDYWHHVTSSALTMQVADPLDRAAFGGRLTCLDFGAVRWVQIKASASKVSRTRAHVGYSSQPVYLLRLALEGEITALQDGREAHLCPGDFTLCDTTRPYQILFRDPIDVLVIRISRDKLLPFIGRPEAMLGVRMPGDSGLSGLASRHLRDLWAASQDFLSHDASPRLVEMSLQLLASAYSILPKAKVERSSLVGALRAQVLTLIERELFDPELSPSAIAARIGVTPGYIHRIFRGEFDTVSRYILQRRLEESARALRDPLQAGRSITAIAIGVGFNSLPHFSRVFREQFGATPSEYRKQ